MIGHFNAHLRDAVLLFADEAFWAGDKQGEPVLKMLITEEILPIEQKGHDVIFVKNHIHLVIASNSEWVVPSGLEERRFCVLDVGEARMQDRNYFRAIAQQMDGDGRAALLHDLLNHDLSDFDVAKVPTTEALREQKLLSMEYHQKWWYQKLEDGVLLPDHKYWETEVMRDILYHDYVIAAGLVGVRHKATPSILGTHLRNLLPDGYPKRSQRSVPIQVRSSSNDEDTEIKTPRKSFWLFPILEKCRAHFDKITKTDHDWPDDERHADLENRKF